MREGKKKGKDRLLCEPKDEFEGKKEESQTWEMGSKGISTLLSN